MRQKTKVSRYLKTSVVAGLLPLTLAGCLEMGSMFKGEPGPYDGRWAGRLTLSIGDKTCIRRMNISGTVSGHWFSGTSKNGKTTLQYSGVIKDGGILDGELVRKKFSGTGTMTGTFESATASGEWQNKRCKGKWTLRRVSVE